MYSKIANRIRMFFAIELRAIDRDGKLREM